MFSTHLQSAGSLYYKALFEAIPASKSASIKPACFRRNFFPSDNSMIANQNNRSVNLCLENADIDKLSNTIVRDLRKLEQVALADLIQHGYPD